MSEPSQKCDNNAIFKQNYTQKLFISFKISYSCCFGFRENLEFPDFLQKKFYNIDYWTIKSRAKFIRFEKRQVLLLLMCLILASLEMLLFLKMDHLRPLFRLFRYFSIQCFHQIKVKKCPSSIRLGFDPTSFRTWVSSLYHHWTRTPAIQNMLLCFCLL